jgi:phosphonate transport system ATP-binding protein
VLENVLHGRLGYKSTIAGTCGFYTASEKNRAYEILHAVGLHEHIYKRCDQLSGGQKQRVGIARALIQDPTLMLCDEPIASLDPSAAKIVMDTLRDINTRLGITVVANLHQVHVARDYATRIIGVNNGRVIYDGLPKDLTIDIIQKIYGSEAQDLILADGDTHGTH